jgi:signal transduction histidine kinase
MKLFYCLFGYLLVGLIVLIVFVEYLGFQAEIELYEADLIAIAVQNGKSISGMIAHVWKESGEEKALRFIDDANISGNLKIRWEWLDTLTEKRRMTDTQERELGRLHNGQTVSFKMDNRSGERISYTYVPVDVAGNRKGALELRQSLVPLAEYTHKKFIRAIVITILFALVSGFFLYVFIDRKVGMPIRRLMAHANRIGRGDFTTDTFSEGNHELAVMARTMNDMCSRLLIAKEKIQFEYDMRLKTLDQLRHTERLSSFGLISAGIAHELGTPLNVVDGRAKMIISEELSDKEVRDCASIIKSQAERMTLIIRQLLDFTRRPRQHVAPEDIALLVKQVFQLLYPMAGKQHVHFSLKKTEDADVVLVADSVQIQQVLVNLLMNGIQAMPRGGKVEVSLSNEMLSPAQNENGKPEKYLKIRIHDEGEGICRENLENIFTPFFTTKTIGTGTGLGLSIAHGIVEEHGGWIDVESTVHQGACFTVYLPLRKRAK